MIISSRQRRGLVNEQITETITNDHRAQVLEFDVTLPQRIFSRDPNTTVCYYQSNDLYTTRFWRCKYFVGRVSSVFTVLYHYSFFAI